MVPGIAQSRPFDELHPLPPGATWDTLYRVFHEHRFVDDGDVAETFSDFVVHRLATRWSTTPALAELVAKDSAFGAFVVKHVDATADSDELRRVIIHSSAACPRPARSLCAAINAAATNAAAQGAQPN